MGNASLFVFCFVCEVKELTHTRTHTYTRWKRNYSTNKQERQRDREKFFLGGASSSSIRTTHFSISTITTHNAPTHIEKKK